MRTFTNYLARAAAVLLLAVFGSIGAWAETNAAGGGTSNKIVVVSDMHVMAPNLLESGAETQDAWLNYYAGQRKMVQQSAAIFDQFMNQMMVLQPKVLLITGDLTKDGETASHNYVRDGLQTLKNAGIKVFVIPGNHDFGAEGNHTQFNADGTTENAEVLTTSQFATFYNGYGYGDAGSEYDPNSLSYVAEPTEGLALLAIDSHSASISDETLEWLSTKAKAARNAGKQVIAMMHHPLFPHITRANLFIDTYTVANYETVRNALIEAGVNTILTGHFHTSDIAKDWNDDEDKAVYDINTGSLVSYPCDYRILTPSQDLMTLQVATQSIVPTSMTADECKTWLQGRVKSLATQKMNAKAGAMAGMFATQIGNIAEFAANLFIVHAEGDENQSASSTALATAYENYKNDATYNNLFTAGGITDANIYSMLEDLSNYGTTKENQINDRSLIIPLPEVGPFIPSEPAVVTVGKAQYTSEIPLSASHAWVLSKQLYTAKEINHKGKIWSLAFNTTKGDLTRNLTVYIAQTSSSYASWDVITEANRVFSGEVTFTAGQWNTIYFDKPFEYDGKSNVVVVVDDNTGKSSGYWGVLTHYIFYGDSGCSILYDDQKDIDPLDGESISNASNSNSYSYKNEIKFTFGEYPLPSDFTVSDIGNVSAKTQCSLRGNATGWNLRYRKVAADGEEEQEWTMVSGITTNSKLISGLTAATKYEAQVQGVFAEDNVSGWTELVTFTTNCCPVEEQGEIIYALSSYGRLWNEFAVQILDVTDKANPVEVACLRSPDSDTYGGTLTLCCKHEYKVNWIYDEGHASSNKWYSFALFFEPGDEFFSMARGEAPNKTEELTEFKMDCTPHCVPKPKNFTVESSTFNSATLTFTSETNTGEFVYSTVADFDPEKATSTSVTFDAVAVRNTPFDDDPNTANSSLTLTGLESLTKYYVRVRSICSDEPGGNSRWSDPVEVTTGSLYDAPGQVTVTNIDSRTVKVSHTRYGGEKKSNVYYRQKAPGNPIDASALVTFGNVQANNEQGFDFDGEVTWSSYGYEQRPFSNVLYYPGIPAGSNFSFNVSNWNSKGGLVKFLWGFKKIQGKTPQEVMEAFDMECLSDADRAARIKELQTKIAETDDEEVKAKLQADIDLMNALPTDAQKLARMKELENLISNSTDEAEKVQYATELNNLRAMMSAAENDRDSGFSITREDNQSNARSRGLDDGEYAFFIRHANDDGYLAARDFTLTPPENLNEWIVIRNISDTEYTLAGLNPGTTYEVMVEPVYEDGTTGTHSAITVFTTLSKDEEPLKGAFSVSNDKRVQFAKGNLRYNGDEWFGSWSMAENQYDMLGQKNLDEGFTAELKDLLCWSTEENYHGVDSYNGTDDETAWPKFQGGFADWGQIPAIISQFGSGWQTLSKDEWSYLLSERNDAEQLRSFATVAGVKGLVLLPDEWDAPDGVMVKEVMTADEWVAIENTGAVFLPAAGQMISTEDPNTTENITAWIEGGSYWSSSPAGDNKFAFAMTFTDSEVSSATETSRRTYTAVRLVKTFILMGDANGDDKVDAADIVEMINAKNDQASARFIMKYADMDGDGKITDIDITAVVYIIMTSE